MALCFGSIVVLNQLCLIGKYFMMLLMHNIDVDVSFIRTVQEQATIIIFIMILLINPIDFIPIAETEV